MAATRNRQRIVLVGGGHAHVQVLERLGTLPRRAHDVTVIVDRPIAVYSGMVPGYVAGDFEMAELQIDVDALAGRVGASVVGGAVERVDPEARVMHVHGHAPIPFDVASLNIGSTVIGHDRPDVRAHAWPTRPIGGFIERLDDVITKARALDADRPFRVLVVGGGAGGVELAFTLAHRLRGERDGAVEVTLVDGGEQVLAGYPARFTARIEKHARRERITLRMKTRVETIDAAHANVRDGDPLPFDALVWVTGAAAHDLGRASGLAVDARGFMLVRPTLQVRDHDHIFAVGDCATLIEAPGTPKAGVYAVRQGPLLADNLGLGFAGGELRAYHPQRDFLTLLNLGGGRAAGAKWGVTFEGRWVHRWKTRIDRAFMRRFQ